MTIDWNIVGISKSAEDCILTENLYGEYYATLFQHLSDKIKKNRPHLAKKKVLFYEDNGPYLPDLAPRIIFS